MQFMNDSQFDPARILDDVWTRLAAGAIDRTHSFYLPAIAITSPAGEPTIRTVVLRKVDRAGSVISFQADRRSPKCEMLARNPAVAWLFYDDVARIQLRVKSVASIHTDDEIAKAAWAEVPVSNRMNYAGEFSPGTAIPRVYRSPTQWREAGRENFATVLCSVMQIDWLMLHPEGHRRLRFTIDGASTTHEWLVP